jgi:hypothetical protein
LPHTVRGFVVIKIPFPAELGQQVACALNRACDQLREEADKRKKSEGALLVLILRRYTSIV